MITTEAELAHALNLSPETLALGAQAYGSGKHYLREVILEVSGEMRVLCRGEGGKGLMRAGECFEKVYGEPLVKKGKRK